MADIQAFRAIRYTESELSELITPPYDILSDADKRALLAKDSQNIVAIDLPHVPPKTAGPDSVYDRAAGDLVSWMDTHRLARDVEPALYAYHQTYQLGEKTLTRKKFFARLRIEKLGEGCVFPHEQTFGGPKEDRLKLTRSTRCNMSPIFGLYTDPDNKVHAAFAEELRRTPDATANLDGVFNQLWVVTDADAIQEVQSQMAEKAIYIADGHHRYSTAYNYMQEQVADYGELPASHPANFVLTVFGAMEDPGATIQPYFRCIVDVPAVSASLLKTSLASTFHWTETPLPATPEELARCLAKAGPQAFMFYVARDEKCAVLSPKQPDLLAAFEPARHASWRKLPYSILHRYVVDEVLARTVTPAQPPTLHYHKTLGETVADARANQGIGVLMPATTMTQLREVCAAGELMPQKSTYFHPKLVTGLVINPLY